MQLHNRRGRLRIAPNNTVRSLLLPTIPINPSICAIARYLCNPGKTHAWDQFLWKAVREGKPPFALPLRQFEKDGASPMTSTKLPSSNTNGNGVFYISYLPRINEATAITIDAQPFHIYTVVYENRNR
jgi:hypothetical protein